jgi:hypothetical protein
VKRALGIAAVLLSLTFVACTPTIQTGVDVAGTLVSTIDPASFYTDGNSIVFDNTAPAITTDALHSDVFLYGTPDTQGNPFQVFIYTDPVTRISTGCSLTTKGVVTAPNGFACHKSYDGIGVELGTVKLGTRVRLGTLGMAQSGNVSFRRDKSPRFETLKTGK